MAIRQASAKTRGKRGQEQHFRMQPHNAASCKRKKSLTPFVPNPSLQRPDGYGGGTWDTCGSQPKVQLAEVSVTVML